MTTDLSRHVAAIARLKRALDCIDEAQSLVERALQALATGDQRRPEIDRLAHLCHSLSWTWIEASATANRLRRSPRPAPRAK